MDYKDQESHKKCRKCNTVKLITDFQLYKCWGFNKPESPYYRRALLCRQCEAQEKQKRKAGKLFRKALRCGEIIKARHCEVCGSRGKQRRVMGNRYPLHFCDTCDTCGKNNRISGHHENYNYPLKVVWLCDACHRGVHGGKGFKKKRLREVVSQIFLMKLHDIDESSQPMPV